ncbi:hypothetical protein R3P38DRAFT_3220974 [Favolaschia claudopus]|uniref:Uncharacterized protein n=1 Tax=Favolaschia claudopus TaxID=2862362 RepID=A0AAW0A0N1_9AGAR
MRPDRPAAGLHIVYFLLRRQFRSRISPPLLLSLRRSDPPAAPDSSLAVVSHCTVLLLAATSHRPPQFLSGGQISQRLLNQVWQWYLTAVSPAGSRIPPPTRFRFGGWIPPPLLNQALRPHSTAPFFCWQPNPTAHPSFCLAARSPRGF